MPINCFPLGRRRQFWILQILVAVSTLLLAGRATFAQVGQEGRTTRFMIPEYYEEDRGQPGQTNRVKSLIMGAQAEYQPSGLIQVEQMRIEYYEPDGRTNLVATAPRCILDRNARVASSAGPLQIETADGDLRIQGEGFLARMADATLVISNRVRTQIEQGLVEATTVAAPAPGPAAPSIRPQASPHTNRFVNIFSDHFVLNYHSNRAVYSEQVRVDDPQFELTCRQLTLTRSTNGGVERIVAERDVVIIGKENQSRAHGDHAVYSISRGGRRVELTGVPATWEGEGRKGRAQQIVFHPDENIFRMLEQASLQVPQASLPQMNFTAGGIEGQPSGTNGWMRIDAEMLEVLLPATNRPQRVLVAETNVRVRGESGSSEATGQRLVYEEAAGRVELTGSPVWREGAREVRGEMLLFDRTNQTFTASGQAFLRMPLQALGGRARVLTGAATNAVETNQFLEVRSRRAQYRPGWLSFDGDVRAGIIEGRRELGRLVAGWAGVKLSNQVEFVEARGTVFAEQLPSATKTGRGVTRYLHAEYVRADVAADGNPESVLALTNAVLHQASASADTPGVEHSWLLGELVLIEFFPATNQVESIIAEENVRIDQAPRSAAGERAVYTATNETVVLTGNPTAEVPEGRITRAEALLWNRAKGKLSSRGRTVIEVQAGTNDMFRTESRLRRRNGAGELLPGTPVQAGGLK